MVLEKTLESPLDCEAGLEEERGAEEVNTLNSLMLCAKTPEIAYLFPIFDDTKTFLI